MGTKHFVPGHHKLSVQHQRCHMFPNPLLAPPLTCQCKLLIPSPSHEFQVPPRAWTSLFYLLQELPTQMRRQGRDFCSAAREWAAAGGGRERKSVLLLGLEDHVM